MDKNIILAGVGGQGILSIAFVIDNAALDSGYQFKQAEVHGMAQRGGAVQSHLRYADHEIYSDLVPQGRCDMVLSVEPLEVMRYWHYLSPDGWVVTSVTPYVNIPDYPDMDGLLDELSTFPNLMMVDSGQLAKAAGSLRAQNMVVVGAASSLLDFSEDQLLKYVEALFSRKGQRIVDTNCRAFGFGRAAGQLFRALVEGGLTPRQALSLCQRISPETIDPTLAPTWVDVLSTDAGALDRLAEHDGPIACDQARTLLA
jgi:indolepyruvate ferredoxin oxidoreductase beta subunit